MDDIIKVNAGTSAEPHPAPKKFRGYTIDEIKYRRVLVSLKKEVYKERLINSYRGLVEASPLHRSPNKGRKTKRQHITGSIMTKILHSLDMVDYAVLGFSLYKSVTNVANFFRRKKK